MKIIALGVNSAFAVGKYSEAYDAEKLENLLSFYTGLFIDEDLKSKIRSMKRKLYLPRWQSNFLIEFKQKGKFRGDVYRLVIDFGGDIRHSLAEQNLSISDIDGWYCSHPHNDHVGGIEGIALSTFFNPYFSREKRIFLDGRYVCDIMMEENSPDVLPSAAKPDLYAHVNVMDEIWKGAEPGLTTLQGARAVSLSTYFNLIHMYDNREIHMKDGEIDWTIYPVISTHVMSGASMMPSYGLMFEGSHKKKIYMPTDSMFMSPAQIITYYKIANVVYQDCETGFRSGVHPFIDDLRNKLEPDIKKKLLLYHYNQEPVVEKDEFLGVLKIGDTRVF